LLLGLPIRVRERRFDNEIIRADWHDRTALRTDGRYAVKPCRSWHDHEGRGRAARGIGVLRETEDDEGAIFDLVGETPVSHEVSVSESLEVEVEEGVWFGRQAQPLASVGVYAPGGTAVYPSSVLMGVVPARAD
jgi:histidinol dehydrogenase